ncbi:MAG: serine hydrolase, partial [Actinobacteria bacterium]|nr:beta-lactamase family protein [Actinomycetota bacterium]NIS31261.1 beta-lactamase family protein [Actinomycetota bacterium]NIU66394.1 beta-lactamase family protein [Actinomycetota bacterium]NIW28202.1 serine hydrolase [Actinomycetota bacterium]NIX20710.1 serine hydrolase [Actinomycetota bacterium]
HLDVDQPVASVIPEFGANGKDGVTYRHVLTHTGGFPMAPVRYEAMRDRSKRLEAMSKWT